MPDPAMPDPATSDPAPITCRTEVHKSEYSIDMDGVPHKLGAHGPSGKYVGIAVLDHAGAASKGALWVFVHVAQSRPRLAALSSLALAHPPRPPAAAASSTRIIGSFDDPAVELGRRLAARFGRPVFVSLNVAGAPSTPGADAETLVAVEKCLVADLAAVL